VKYRPLRKNEKPDRAKGDQYTEQPRLWYATGYIGNKTVREIQGQFPDLIYRIPIREEKT
jgi:hypothetical protein